MSDNTINLEVEPRSVTGKAVKQLRRAGQVPAVIHDHGKESVAVQGPYLAMYRTYQEAGKHHPVDLVVGSHKYTALIKSATFEPKKNQLSHIVFNAVNKNQKVEAEVPVRPRYDEGNEVSPAERASLIVLAQLESVEVKAVPDKIPDVLEYDGEKLVEVGDHVTVADLVVPDGVEVVTEPEHTIATVYEPSALAAANDAAGGSAEAETAEEVESEHASGAEEGAQAAEVRPGGKQEKEDSSQAHNPEKK
jgi:large subunit ribosomal protein L25